MLEYIKEDFALSRLERQPIKSRYIADRVLMLLLYRPASEAEGIQRMRDGSLLLKMGPIARALRINSTELYGQLMFLEQMGYLDRLDLRYKYGHVRVRPAKPLVRWDTANEA